MRQLALEEPDSTTRKFLSRAVAARVLSAQSVDEAQKEQEQSPFVSKLSTRQLRLVQEYIDSSVSRAMLVEDMATSIGMSRSQFARRFKASTDMTPHQAVIAARIRKAKALLAEKTLSIDDVAKDSGFSNASHLASIFRQNLKMSPSVYRARTGSVNVTSKPRDAVDGSAIDANAAVPSSVRCDTRLLSPAATIGRPNPLPMAAEFGLEQTTLRTGDDVRIVASSQGLGWTDLFVAVTEEMPHETLHRAVPDVWLASSLTPAEILRVGANCDYNQILPKGSVTVTAPGEAMYDNIAVPLKAAHLYLRRGIIDDVAKELFTDSDERREICSVFCSTDVVLQQLTASIRMLIEEPPEGNQLKVDYLSQALAARLLERYSVVGLARIHSEPHTFNSSEIGQVIDYVNENLSSNLTIDELAKLVGLGRARFIRRFKATTSITPHQFVILRRVWKARRLLVEKGMDQTEIALHCGFVSQSHFISTFKKVVGMTPSEYRLAGA
jgi:transcriptional regulator GlxA family with amidase domain